VPERANAQLTFHGGAVVVLCGGTTLAVGDITTAGARASGSLQLTTGLLLAETHPESRVFAPLRLSVLADAGTVHNDDGARFAVSTGGVRVAQGVVTRDGVAVQATRGGLACGDGVGLPEPGGVATPPPPSEEPSTGPTSLAPAPSPSSAQPSSAGASRTPTASPTAAPTTKTPSATPTTGAPTTSPPPPNRAPAFGSATVTSAVAQIFNGKPCPNSTLPITVGMTVSATDPDGDAVTVTDKYSLAGHPYSGSGTLARSGTTYTGSFAAPQWAEMKTAGGTIALTFTATDPAGHATTLSRSVKVEDCIIIS
jgi:putative peptide zinc metalloprotease protein